MRRLPLVLLALWPCLAPAGAADGSLEELLEDVRRRRAEALAALERPVSELLARAGELPSADAAALAPLQEELRRLGPEAAVLLVPRIDPGAGAGEADRSLARRVVRLLEAVPTRATTTALVQTARAGSPEGRRNAIFLLGTSPDRARASACLTEVVRGSKGEERAAALSALARLGGPESQEILIESLRASDPEVLRAVLVALADQGAAAARAHVRDLVDAPIAAAPLVPELLAYYRSIGVAFDEEDAVSLVRLAVSDSPVKEHRLAILDALPKLGAGIGTRIRKHFQPLLDSADAELKEGAQIALARLGDRNERRDLLKRYDELVARNEAWGSGYEKRGALLIKLGDYGDAAKDYVRAIQIYRDLNRGGSLDALYVELARAYALDSNPRKAAEALEEGKVPRSMRRALAKDPDFKALAEHSRYGKALEG